MYGCHVIAASEGGKEGRREEGRRGGGEEGVSPDVERPGYITSLVSQWLTRMSIIAVFALR